MDKRLTIQPGQTALTPEQEVTVQRFADERIAAQLSTEPVDETEAEAWLHQAYQVVGLAPPRQILWLDGPLPLVSRLAHSGARVRDWAQDNAWIWVRDRVTQGQVSLRLDPVTPISVRSLRDRPGSSIAFHQSERVQTSAEVSIWDGLAERMQERVRARVQDLVGQPVRASVRASVPASVWDRLGGTP